MMMTTMTQMYPTAARSAMMEMAYQLIRKMVTCVAKTLHSPWYPKAASERISISASFSLIRSII
jgi:hypothetical protein